MAIDEKIKESKTSWDKIDQSKIIKQSKKHWNEILKMENRKL